MKQRVNFHSGGQLQAVGVGADNLDDIEWAQVLEVQPLGGLGGLNVLGAEPHKISLCESRAGVSGGVDMLFLTILRETNLGPEIVVDLLHVGGEVSARG